MRPPWVVRAVAGFLDGWPSSFTPGENDRFRLRAVEEMTGFGAGQSYCPWPLVPHRTHTLALNREARRSAETPFRSFSFSSFSASVRLFRSAGPNFFLPLSPPGSVFTASHLLASLPWASFFSCLEGFAS